MSFDWWSVSYRNCMNSLYCSHFQLQSTLTVHLERSYCCTTYLHNSYTQILIFIVRFRLVEHKCFSNLSNNASYYILLVLCRSITLNNFMLSRYHWMVIVLFILDEKAIEEQNLLAVRLYTLNRVTSWSYQQATQSYKIKQI